MDRFHSRSHLSKTIASILVLGLSASCGSSSKHTANPRDPGASKAIAVDSTLPKETPKLAGVALDVPTSKGAEAKVGTGEVKPTEPSPSEVAPIADGGSEVDKGENCEFGNLVVENSFKIKINDHCEVLHYKSISVQKGGILQIAEGVKLALAGTGKDAGIQVDAASAIEARGSKDKKILIIGSDAATVLLDLRGKTSFEHIDFENASLLAWGPNAEKTFQSLAIDNSRSPAGTTAIGCNNCDLKVLKDISIEVNEQGLPLVSTLSSWASADVSSLKISGSAHPSVLLYGGEQTRALQVDQYLRDLGYPYQIKSIVNFQGKKFTIEPGVDIDVCTTCLLRMTADEVVIGDRAGEPVTIGAPSGFPGFEILKTNSLQINKLKLTGSSGVRHEDCPVAAFAFHGKTQIELGELFFKPLSGDLFSLSSEASLTLQSSFDFSGNALTVSYREALTPKSITAIEALKEKNSVKLKKCGEVL